jgi:anhydro-N-acetylmuramic acid kinase
VTLARYIGLISGTSRDGLDAALVAMEDGAPRLIAAHCFPYPPELAEALKGLIDLGRRPLPTEVHELDDALGHFFADCSLDLLETAGLDPGDVRAVGSHGQTVWHEPDGPDPVSLQLGSAEVLARETGLPVVSDFRSDDLLAGGQGAPLAPLLHRALFSGLAPCAVLNLGGIANLTLLTDAGEVTGFDTGPANCLLDAWCARHQGEAFDADGAWARDGEVLPALLNNLLDESYFRTTGPKSTGLEQFNLRWLDARLQGDENPADVQRTLLELTVESIAQNLTGFEVESTGAVLVCGGGVHNRFLMERLEQRLAPRRVCATNDFGVDADWVEAILFAWLAHQRVEGRRLVTAPITGAREPVFLGRVLASQPQGANL